MMSSQSGKDPKVDSFDRTKAFVAIRDNPTVGFMQNRCAFDARARFLPEVTVGMVGGKDPDGIKFFLDGEPYLGDGVKFVKIKSKEVASHLAATDKPQLAVVPQVEHDGHAAREADLKPPQAKKGRQSKKSRKPLR